GGGLREASAARIALDEVDEPGGLAGRSDQRVEAIVRERLVDVLAREAAVRRERLAVLVALQAALRLRCEEELLAEVRHLLRRVRLVERDDVGERLHRRAR